MPRLYLAKINLNSSIFDAYNNTLRISDVMKKVFDGCTDGMTGKIKKKHRDYDKFGNPFTYTRETNYSFYDLEKDPVNQTIAGYIIRTYYRPNERKNKETQKIETVQEKQNVSIYFFFDVKNEMVAFCERQSFGYNQFMDGLRLLINKSTDGDYSFEIYLQKDSKVLQEKLAGFEKVTKLKLVIIPPNATEEDSLEELRELSNTIVDAKSLNSHKTTVECSSDNIDMSSPKIVAMQKLVSHGYGDLTIRGIDKTGKGKTINSSSDAAFTSEYNDHFTPASFKQAAKDLMNLFCEWIR